MLNVWELAPAKAELKRFMKFAYKFYKDDPNWVPPLRSDMMSILSGVHNTLFRYGPHTFFMAYRDGEPVGRILAGIDEKLNAIYKMKQAYFALFECANDQEAANGLFTAALNWAKQKGMDTIIGPVSPTNGDDAKGVLIQGFDERPKLMNSYNPRYYVQLYENFGFRKDEDHIAYIIHDRDITFNRKKEQIEKAKARFGFSVKPLSLDDIPKAASELHHVLIEGMPIGWQYTTPPDVDALVEEIMNLKMLYKGKYVYVSYSPEGEPIGFVVGLPDYNQVLRRMNGRLFPIGWMYFLAGARRINGIRMFVQFVSRKHVQKGINSAMFWEVYQDFQRDGMEFCEASTIGEYNTPSIASIMNLGFEPYRVYRVYRKDF